MIDGLYWPSVSEYYNITRAFYWYDPVGLSYQPKNKNPRNLYATAYVVGLTGGFPEEVYT